MKGFAGDGCLHEMLASAKAVVEMSYGPPRPKSGWWDGLACIATGVLIHVAVQSLALACLIFGLDWVWKGALRVVLPLTLLACCGYVCTRWAISRWRTGYGRPRLRVVWD